MRLSTLFGIAVTALVASFASASALPPVRAGILECQGGQNVGFVVGSVTSLECVFQSEGRRPEPYIATVRRYRRRSRLHRADPVLLGGECADQTDWARRSRRQLWRRRRQRIGRGRFRRQFSGRRSGEFLRAAADQRAGPDRIERRGRRRRYRVAAGTGPGHGGRIITGITITAEQPQRQRNRPAKRAFFAERHSGAMQVANRR